MPKTEDQPGIVFYDTAIDRIVYRASALGGCERALVAARLGYEPTGPPEKLQVVFDVGHDAEDWAMTRLPGAYGQQDAVRLDIPGTQCSIIGHMDGWIGGYVVEVKSQSPAEYDKWTEDSWTTTDLWRKYAWQVSAMMHAVGGADLELVRVRRPGECDCGADEWTETMDADFHGPVVHLGDCGSRYRMSIHHYKTPFHTLDEIYARVKHCESFDDLPGCDRDPAWGCPFWQLHEQAEMVGDDELDRACQDLKDIQGTVKAWKEDEARAKEKVTKLLAEYEAQVDGDKTTRKVVTAGFKVTWSSYPVAEKVVKAHVTTRLTVTGTGGRVSDE